jgi:hypothetical protein
MFKIRIFFADRFDRLVLRRINCDIEEMILKYTEVTRKYIKKTLYIQYVYLDQIEFSCSEICLDLDTSGCVLF